MAWSAESEAVLNQKPLVWMLGERLDVVRHNLPSVVSTRLAGPAISAVHIAPPFGVLACLPNRPVFRSHAALPIHIACTAEVELRTAGMGAEVATWSDAPRHLIDRVAVQAGFLDPLATAPGRMPWPTLRQISGPPGAIAGHTAKVPPIPAHLAGVSLRYRRPALRADHLVALESFLLVCRFAGHVVTLLSVVPDTRLFQHTARFSLTTTTPTVYCRRSRATGRPGPSSRSRSRCHPRRRLCRACPRW